MKRVIDFGKHVHKHVGEHLGRAASLAGKAISKASDLGMACAQPLKKNVIYYLELILTLFLDGFMVCYFMFMAMRSTRGLECAFDIMISGILAVVWLWSFCRLEFSVLAVYSMHTIIGTVTNAILGYTGISKLISFLPFASLLLPSKDDDTVDQVSFGISKIIGDIIRKIIKHPTETIGSYIFLLLLPHIFDGPRLLLSIPNTIYGKVCKTISPYEGIEAPLYCDITNIPTQVAKRSLPVIPVSISLLFTISTIVLIPWGLTKLCPIIVSRIKSKPTLTIEEPNLDSWEVLDPENPPTGSEHGSKTKTVHEIPQPAIRKNQDFIINIMDDYDGTQTQHKPLNDEHSSTVDDFSMLEIQHTD